MSRAVVIKIKFLKKTGVGQRQYGILFPKKYLGEQGNEVNQTVCQYRKITAYFLAFMGSKYGQAQRYNLTINSVQNIFHSMKSSLRGFLPKEISCFFRICLIISGCGKSANKSAEQRVIDHHNEDERNGKMGQQEYNELLKSPGGALSIGTVRFPIGPEKRGRLPGGVTNLLKNPLRIEDKFNNCPSSRSITLLIQRGTLEDHYTVVKVSANESWKPQKAWQTDAQGNMMEDYINN